MKASVFNELVIKFIDDIDEKNKYKEDFNFRIKKQTEWITNIFKSSMIRLDNQFLSLYKHEDKYFNTKCLPFYNDIKNKYKFEQQSNENDIRIENHYNISKIVIPSDVKDNDIESLKYNLASYHKCRKYSREKTDLIKGIFEYQLNGIHSSLNFCLLSCRTRISELNLIDCYSECISNNINKIAEMEHYLTFSINQMVNEYNNSVEGFQPSSLSTVYRLGHRKLTNDILKNYI